MATVYLGGTPGGGAAGIPLNSIVLGAATILDWVRQPRHDGAAYLWTDHRIRIRSLFSPLATSATIQGNAVRQAPGNSAPLTDVALRHYLECPRRQIVVKYGATTVLHSPRPGYTVDSAGGPFVHVNDVSLISGTKTYIVDLTIETAINERHLFGVNALMLSHRWTMEHDIDQDHYTTRTIHGHAYFDRGELARQGFRADDFRAYLFHPVPQTMQRVAVQALVDERDGRVDYVVVDRERAQNFIPGFGMTRIEAGHSSSTEKGDFWENAAGSLSSTIEGVNRLRKKRDDPAQGSTNPLEWAMFLARQAAGALRDNVPSNVQSMTARVWGNRSSTRENLMLAAMAACQWRLQHLLNGSNATHAELFEDVAGKFCMARLQVTSGFVNQILGGNLRPEWPALPGQGPGRRDLPRGLLRENIPFIFDARAGANPVAPGAARGARGTYVEALVSAALLPPATTPPQPVATPRAADRNP